MLLHGQASIAIVSIAIVRIATISIAIVGVFREVLTWMKIPSGAARGPALSVAACSLSASSRVSTWSRATELY